MEDEKKCRLLLCTRGTLIVVGVVFELTLMLVMIFPYVAQYATYRVQRSPSITKNYNFQSPPRVLVSFHWVCFALSFVFGLTFLYTGGQRTGFCLLVSCAAVFVIGYIAYLLSFFLSGAFVWYDSYMSLDQANALLAAAKSTRPDLGFRATGSDSALYTSVGLKSCHTKRVPLEVTYFADVSPEFEVTLEDMAQLTAWRLKMNTTVKFINESIQNMKEIEAYGAKCVYWKWDERRVDTLVSIPGLPKEIVVTHDGRRLPGVGKSNAVMSGLFLHGLAYAYRVALIPSVTVNITQNVIFKRYAVSSICDDLGECK